MKKSQLRQIFKDLKVETDKETEDKVLDAIKKGKIKNNKEAIKKWLQQNTNQPFTNKIKESNKMKKSQLRQIIREEIKSTLKEEPADRILDEGRWIEKDNPDGVTVIISFEELTEDDLGLDYGSMSPEDKKVEQRDGLKMYTYYI